MKRWLLLVLVLLLILSGCTVGGDPSHTDSSEETETSAPPPGIYDAENPIEAETAGAVSAYQLDSGVCTIAFMGKKLLLFYNDGESATRVVSLDRQNEYIQYETVL